MNFENSLLSLLKPGEMIRFSVSRKRGGFDYQIEGRGNPEDPELLAQRLEAGLRLARDHGYSFARDANFSLSEDQDFKEENPPERERGVWWEVRPVGRRIAAPGSVILGFRAEGRDETVSSNGSIWFPDFTNSLPGKMSSEALSGLAVTPGFEEMELDFEAISLSVEAADVLARLRSRAEEWSSPAIPGQEDFAEGGGLGSMRRYLDLWLWHRRGWKVSFRVCMRGAVDRAAVDLAGRGVFGTECLVVDQSGFKQTDDEGQLPNLCYPSGWPVPGLLEVTRRSRKVRAQRLYQRVSPIIPETGVQIGTAEGVPVRFPATSRNAHTYIAGATGTGKSTLLLRLMAEDFRKGESVVLLDPHGDLYREALKLVPPKRIHQVMMVDPQSDQTPSFNVLDIMRDRHHRRMVDMLAGGLMSFFLDTWDGVDAFGPVFETYYLNTLLLLALQTKHSVSLTDFSKVFTNESFRKKLMDACEDESVSRFWAETANQTRGDLALPNVAPYISSKVDPLIRGSILGKMLGGKRDELSLGDRMDKGGIILVNLDKGALGFRQSRLLGTLLAIQLFGAGLARSSRPPEKRQTVNIYIDEFQNFVSGNLADMLSEARKFGLRLTLANQTLGQLEGGRRSSNMVDAVLGNAGNQIFFRLGVSDSRRLAEFTSPLSPREMQFLPNHHALGRFLEEGCPLPPFVFRTLAAPIRVSSTRKKK